MIRGVADLNYGSQATFQRSASGVDDTDRTRDQYHSSDYQYHFGVAIRIIGPSISIIFRVIGIIDRVRLVVRPARSLQ